MVDPLDKPPPTPDPGVVAEVVATAEQVAAIVTAAEELLAAMDYFQITDRWMEDMRMGAAITSLRAALAPLDYAA